jgi:hypothetical protein
MVNKWSNENEFSKKRQYLSKFDKGDTTVTIKFRANWKSKQKSRKSKQKNPKSKENFLFLFGFPGFWFGFPLVLALGQTRSDLFWSLNV